MPVLCYAIPMRSAYEKQAQKELEAEGYLVDFKIRPRFPMKGYNVDFLGLFDLIAIKLHPEDYEGVFRLIAIKGTAGDRAKIIKEIEAIRFPPGCQKEIWYIRVIKKKKEWVKRILA